MGALTDVLGRRPPDEVTVLRDDVDHIPGQLAFQRRLNLHGLRMYPTFNSLDVMPVDAAIDLVKDQLVAAGASREQSNKFLMIMLAFGTIMVEAERERVRGEEEMKT